jgi:hypothetical protein
VSIQRCDGFPRETSSSLCLPVSPSYMPADEWVS